MAFEVYSDVILTRYRRTWLRAGDVGTVVERHAVTGLADEGYSVEFFDMIGNTVAVRRQRTARPCGHSAHKSITPGS
ncbi:MAG: hypothetical protein A3F70_00255 [Acidobacteria bacterium RIFCSPLOWO2_12_FULL_67_14]|nr:MAG: hypothetical protein A3H29_17320 [Acidobacteria bacterium RIFCSPLOWO2_02_FULL_67_21]OFW41369.1 MAG: hypothetical protein A3F70_00255 [Acidobacteria bacterium RIFCSPLOWO2_12_FULL_67_14]